MNIDEVMALIKPTKQQQIMSMFSSGVYHSLNQINDLVPMNKGGGTYMHALVRTGQLAKVRMPTRGAPIVYGLPEDIAILAERIEPLRDKHLTHFAPRKKRKKRKKAKAYSVNVSVTQASPAKEAVYMIESTMA